MSNSSGQGAGVVVTLEQIYKEQQDTNKKVDKLITQFEERSDHESRIRSLERKMWAAVGASGTVGAIGGSLILAAVKGWL